MKSIASFIKTQYNWFAIVYSRSIKTCNQYSSTLFAIKCILIFILAISANICDAQVIYGVNNYTEYHPGTLPIIISVPHGGALTPTAIPDRTCNNAVNVTDAYTSELAQQIDSSFVTLTGCHPHIIYCNLDRSKLDCNRNIIDGACGNSIAENAWNEFHNFIVSAEISANTSFGGKAFYIDLHGHGHAIQRLELGYLLYDYELAYPDSILNTAQYISLSSIQNLVQVNVNNYTHSELLRGANALGTLLTNAGYPAVPSQQDPFPGTTTNYFSGGYNCANYTSYVQNNTVNGLQVECNYSNIRDTPLHRKQFADSLARVLINYLAIQQNISITGCTPLALNPVNANGELSLLSTITTAGGTLTLTGSMSGQFQYSVLTINGQEIQSGVITPGNAIQLESGFTNGIYFLKVIRPGEIKTFKISIQ